MNSNSRVGVVDYGGGNIRSLVKALEALHAQPLMVTNPNHFQEADVLFFPGQGAFGDCMAKLNRLELAEPLVAWIHSGKPFFGICVGYQLLFEESEESPGVAGLGVFQGSVTRFPQSDLKVPHMGWNSARLRYPDSAPWQGLGPEPFFYYVHSYYPAPLDDSLCAAETEYGVTFTGAIQRDRLLATQFHPEKSQRAGMKLIGNFLETHGAAVAH